MELWAKEEFGACAVAEPCARKSAHLLRIKTSIALALFDILALSAVFLLTLILLGRSDGITSLMSYLLFGTGLYLACAIYGRAYNHEVIERVSRGLNRSLAAALATAAFLSIIFVFDINFQFKWQKTLLLVSAGGVVALICGRLVFDKMVSQRVRAALFDRVLILDGITMPTPVGFRVIDAPMRAIQPNPHDPMMRHWAALFLQDADRVVVACRSNKYGQWAKFLKGSNVRIEIIVPELNELGIDSISRHGANTTIGVSQGRLSRKNRILKRGFDILMVTLFAAPAFTFIAIGAILIKLEDGGPVLFRQLRVGRGNRLFEVLKLRTMIQSHASGKVTRTGRYLRALSIDELPQLYNVFLGQMSLVGPRPHALESHAEDKLFWEVDEKYWHRHAIKPGITGLAQVNGFRGATIRQSDLSNRLHYDLQYLQGWSIWRDLKIIFATFRVLIHKNAY